METHKDYMNYLKKHDPMTYYEMTSNPTGADSDGSGCVIFIILMIVMIMVGCIFFFGAK